MNILRQTWQALQQKTHSPNIIPSQFQTFSVASAKAVLASLTATNVTPTIDATNQYYGAASLKCAIASSGATLKLFAGAPNLPISPATRWFCSFQILAPSGCTGSLTITTSGGHSVTESFTVSASASWQQVWGLFDLSQWSDPQATWTFTFTSTATVNLDGIQMNAVGNPLAYLPPFSGSQMVLGGLAYGATTDDVPPGNSNTVATTLAVIGAQINLIPDSGFRAFNAYWDEVSNLISVTQNADGHTNCLEYVGTGAASGFQYWATIPFSVVGGTYTLSAEVYGGEITAGQAFLGVYDPTFATQYGSLAITSANNGRISGQITIPGGVTVVTVLFDTGNCTVANTHGLFCQKIQFEPGSVMTAYQETVGDYRTGTLRIDFGSGSHLNKVLDNIGDGATYARTLASVQTSGVPDPSKGGVAAKGSTPPILLGNSFSWSTPSGGGQVTITWSSFTIYRSDGTTTTISGNSQLVTGLTNGVTYTVYPFIPEGTTSVNFAVGFSGAVGTPAMAYAGGSAPAAADMYANSHIPLQSFVVTPVAGGGGGGGGGYGCLHPDTAIELANGKTVLAKQLADGAMLCGRDGPTRITSIVRQECFEWVRVYFRGGSSATVTRDHKFIRPDMSQVKAHTLVLGDIIEGRKLNLEVTALELHREKAQLVAINVESPHMYYVGGALSHNGNPKP